jgi:hypothetical protein
MQTGINIRTPSEKAEAAKVSKVTTTKAEPEHYDAMAVNH